MDNKKAIKHLKKDPVMARLIKKYNEPKWRYSIGLVPDLMRAITNQQLSGKAAATIWERFTKKFGSPPNPAKITKARIESLRSCGLSRAKAGYIKGIARAAQKGELNEKKIKKLSDEEVYEELMKLKGVGAWTAEMIMMFSLGRPDLFSIGDLGLRKAVANLYKVDRSDHEKIIKIAERWRPYRTMASWYLWQSLEND